MYVPLEPPTPPDEIVTVAIVVELPLVGEINVLLNPEPFIVVLAGTLSGRFSLKIPESKLITSPTDIFVIVKTKLLEPPKLDPSIVIVSPVA